MTLLAIRWFVGPFDNDDERVEEDIMIGLVIVGTILEFRRRQVIR